MGGHTRTEPNPVVLRVLVRSALRLCPPVGRLELVAMLLSDALGVLEDTEGFEAEARQ
jgi:hypothetical protein